MSSLGIFKFQRQMKDNIKNIQPSHLVRLPNQVFSNTWSIFFQTKQYAAVVQCVTETQTQKGTSVFNHFISDKANFFKAN